MLSHGLGHDFCKETLLLSFLTSVFASQRSRSELPSAAVRLERRHTPPQLTATTLNKLVQKSPARICCLRLHGQPAEMVCVSVCVRAMLDELWRNFVKESEPPSVRSFSGWGNSKNISHEIQIFSEGGGRNGETIKVGSRRLSPPYSSSNKRKCEEMGGGAGVGRGGRGIIKDFKVVLPGGRSAVDGVGGGGGVMELTITKHHECPPRGKWMSNTFYIKQTEPPRHSGVTSCLCPLLTLCLEAPHPVMLFSTKLTSFLFFWNR